jgi:hypothetical protein
VLSVAITAGVSAVTALIAVIITNRLARRREHEADWRKLKLAQYQGFIIAFSSIEKSRSTPEAIRRYTDAANSMSLIASMSVLRALRNFQLEISYKNDKRSQAEHDRLFDLLIRALRADVQPSNQDDPAVQFFLLGLPPEPKPRDESTKNGSDAE